MTDFVSTLLTELEQKKGTGKGEKKEEKVQAASYTSFSAEGGQV